MKYQCIICTDLKFENEMNTVLPIHDGEVLLGVCKKCAEAVEHARLSKYKD